ncbi:MAG: hypothetical protein OHK0047_02220 [Leptolyngbyaceae cyanobacterium]
MNGNHYLFVNKNKLFFKEIEVYIELNKLGGGFGGGAIVLKSLIDADIAEGVTKVSRRQIGQAP